MADIRYEHEVLQTGDHYDNVAVMPGHHETPETPIGCLCCGKQMYFREPACVCQLALNWHQNEAKQVVCALHLAEKVKDGLYHI